MKIRSTSPPAQSGNALLLVLIMVLVSLTMMLGLFGYGSTNVRLNQRTTDYYMAVGAAEAATEKVLGRITQDFNDYGDGYVQQNLDTYRATLPTTTESSYWRDFVFSDNARTTNHIEVDFNHLPGFAIIGGQYGPLRAYQDQIRILANARWSKSQDNVAGSVFQDIQLSRIPIFQYAIFYNITLEFTPQPPMKVYGPVHCNTNIYMNPAGALSFSNDVTSSGTIVAGPNPAGPFGLLGGTTTYAGHHDSGLSALSLPIGTNNSPAAVTQVLDAPPAGEDPRSSLGSQRYYNKADIIITVSNTSVRLMSGYWNNFAVANVTATNQLYWISTNTVFYNKREAKYVKAINLDIAKFKLWNATNTLIRPTLPLSDIDCIYVLDRRTFASTNQSGVRVINGASLPPAGLTIATASPLYVQGNYNAPASALGTTNTTATLPASFAADAITVLSTNWSDANGLASLSSRIAGNTTVNAAFLCGIVATTMSSDSGGVENFPRFLEDWTSKTLTYNGSMVAMFYSRTATGLWMGIGSTYDIYNPPDRNWGLDQNYSYYNKLPPATPGLTVMVRSQWRTPAAFTTNVMAGF